MTESSLTRRELQRIKARWPDAFLWKVNDRITAGIPDALLVLAGRHVWIEFKALTDNERVETAVRDVQKVQIRRLVRAGAEVLIVAFRKRTNGARGLAKGHDQDLWRMDRAGAFAQTPWSTVIEALETLWNTKAIS